MNVLRKEILSLLRGMKVLFQRKEILKGAARENPTDEMYKTARVYKGTRFRTGICILAMLCLLTGASVSAQAASSSLQLCVGKTKVLTAYKGKKVKWYSSKKSIASVSSKGKVTAKKAGTAIIKAKYGKKTRTYRIKVRNHSYKNATCEKSKTCKYCKAIKGKPLGHKWTNTKKKNEMVCRNCKKIKKIASTNKKPVTPTKKPSAPTTPTKPTSEIYKKLENLKKKYPEGMPWGNDKGYQYQWDGTYCIDGGCAAFAAICSDYLFPGYKRVKHKDPTQIKEGDIVRINHDTHSVVVWGISGDTVTLCEGNYGGTVHWGRTMKMSVLKNLTNYVITRKK